LLLQVVDSLQKGHQAMVFVHSRKDTGKSARMLQMKAQQGGETAPFDCTEEDGWHFMQQEIDKSKNRRGPEARDRCEVAGRG
jgi:replicative superfamily II helicase